MNALKNEFIPSLNLDASIMSKKVDELTPKEKKGKCIPYHLDKASISLFLLIVTRHFQKIQQLSWSFSEYEKK